jgi:iron complex transport system substrate-binding protein
VIWLDTSGAGDLAGPALVYSSVLSLPTVFEELVPQLAAALDGDPSTSTGATTSDAETGTTRSFTDDLGRVVELPANPQRVVILDPSRTMVHLVELGIVPVGATHNDATRGETGLFPDVIGDAAQQITSVGLIGSANLEAVQALQPDLILYNIPYQEIAVDLLAQIAPTVAYEFRSDYEEHFRRTAEIVGREQEAEAIIAAFQQQLDQRAASLQLNGRTFAMPLLVTEGDRLLLFGPGQLLGKTLEQLGGAIVPAAIDGTPLDFASEDISLELLPSLLDADTIILHRYVGRADDDPAVERLTASPIWQAVPAVQRGDVVVVDIQAAVGTFGYSGLNSLLDSIVAQLAP